MGKKTKKRQQKEKLKKLVDALSCLYAVEPKDVVNGLADEFREEFLFKASGLLSKVEGLSFKEAWIEEAFAKLRAIVELLESEVEC